MLTVYNRSFCKLSFTLSKELNKTYLFMTSYDAPANDSELPTSYDKAYNTAKSAAENIKEISDYKPLFCEALYVPGGENGVLTPAYRFYFSFDGAPSGYKCLYYFVLYRCCRYIT